MLSFARDSIKVIEPGTRDDRGTPVRDYDSPDRVSTFPRCIAEPGASDLDLAGRTSAAIRYTVYAPAGARVSEFAAVELRGVRYALDEPPAAWTSPTGSLSHVVLRLVDWKG